MSCRVTRCGYTGEDGFEVSVSYEDGPNLMAALLDQPEVQPCGLGARDSLRLEAGLCLYGHDIDANTTPVEAGLSWSIQRARRTGGDRAGGFPGAERILRELSERAPKKRVGLRPQGRAPMREGVLIFADETSETPIGAVTSGGFGPTVQGPVAMGYVPTEVAKAQKIVFGEVRGKRLPVKIVSLPFTAANFKR